MTGGPRDELVEARADFILAGAHTAKAFAEHFEAQIHGGEFEAQIHGGECEAQMNRGKVRKLLAPLRIFCRKGVILLAVMLAPCALLGYAAVTARPAPVMLSGANGVAAVNTAWAGWCCDPAARPAGRSRAADGSVWVATRARALAPSAIAAVGQAIWSRDRHRHGRKARPRLRARARPDPSALARRRWPSAPGRCGWPTPWARPSPGSIWPPRR